MRIFVKKRIPFVFYVPNCLLHSRLVVAVIVHAMRNDGIPIEQEQLVPLLRQCSAVFRQHRGLPFVEVHAKDGTCVVITL